MKEELPQGWTEALLEELTKNSKQDIVDGPFGSNLKAAEYKESGVPIVRLQNIDRNRFLSKNIRFVTSQKAAELSRHSFQAGDVIITKLGDPVGKACIVPDNLSKGIIVADVVRARIDEQRASKRFVIFAINSPEVIAQLNLEVKGSTRPRVNLGHIRSLSIPLPPLPEQRRIVAKLEKLLHKVDACKERLDKVPGILKRFRQSVLSAACSGRLTKDWREALTQPAATLSQRARGKAPSPAASRLPLPEGEGRGEGEGLPEGWQSEMSGNLFSFITSGSRGWAKYYSDKGPLFIRIGNLDHASIQLDLRSIQKVKPPAGTEGTRTRVQPNDILVSITADVGMIALAPDDIGEAYINQHIALARPTDKCYPRFLAWYLASSEGGLKQLQELQRGATKVGLGLDDIKNIRVPLPPLPEQHEIVRRVEALFKKADEIEGRYRKAKAFVDRLTQSILAKAFRGELVPQDPNDEPASVLLERIKTQRSESIIRGKKVNSKYGK